jgi:hypothetical protein
MYKDLRSTPKGPAQVWETTRLILPPRRKRRIREHLEIAFCESGWHGDDGSADEPDEPICYTLPVMRVSGEPEPKWWGDLDGFHEYHASRPCVWKVESSSKDGRWTTFYCLSECPVEYRELARGSGERVIEPGPQTIAWRSPVAREEVAP